MARKYNDRYVRFYTFGSTAAKLEQERGATLPKYKQPAKRIPIPFDPVAFAGCAVAVVLAILMVVGIMQVNQVTTQVQQMKNEIEGLEKAQQMLVERYESGYDLNEIRAAAISMGMVSAEDAAHVRVEVPAQVVETVQAKWWQPIMMGLRQIFA